VTTANTWPLADLRLQCNSLELAAMRESDLERITEILPKDLELNPAATHFAALDERTNRAVTVRQGYWKSVGMWSPSAWELLFVVRRAGNIIGMQALEGKDFGALRTVDTASWLVTDARGHGYGKVMREAVLHLAFNHLDAVAAITSAWEDNVGSLGVSTSLGYQPNGFSLQQRRDAVATMVHLRMSRLDWQAQPRSPVEVHGLEATKPYFGLK
jgi:RimJ/RimL family protein N-acetyltransferase